MNSVKLTPMALARREMQLTRVFRAVRKRQMSPEQHLRFDYAMVPVPEEYVLTHMPMPSEWN